MQRFAVAAEAGFSAVELQSPYDFSADQIAEQLDRHHLKLVLHNLPAGNWAAGERGIACHPDRIAEFEEGVGKAIAYARLFKTRQLNCLAGIVPPGVSAELAHQTLLRNVRFAAGALKQHNIRLLIEPINTFDVPGFFLSRSKQALDLISESASDNLFLQYDIYHMQRMEGELIRTIANHLPMISHIQLADNPGRGEPGTGEINFGNLLHAIDGLGYQGYIGCEYIPRNGTVAGLKWRTTYGV